MASGVTFCAFPSPPFGGTVVVKVFQMQQESCGEFEVTVEVWRRIAGALRAAQGIQVREYPLLR
jgi:hypothetical protein